MDRVRTCVDLVAAGRYLARTRQPAQGFIEFALLIVVLVAVASVGLAILGTDLQSLFEALGAKLKLPAGF
jgi:Flp pilus assembly pilin Flp